MYGSWYWAVMMDYFNKGLHTKRHGIMHTYSSGPKQSCSNQKKNAFSVWENDVWGNDVKWLNFITAAAVKLRTMVREVIEFGLLLFPFWNDETMTNCGCLLNSIHETNRLILRHLSLWFFYIAWVRWGIWAFSIKMWRHTSSFRLEHKSLFIRRLHNPTQPHGCAEFRGQRFWFLAAKNCPTDCVMLLKTRDKTIATSG